MIALHICLHVSYGNSVTKVIQHVAIASGIKSHAHMIDLYEIVEDRRLLPKIGLQAVWWTLVLLPKTTQDL